MRSDVPSILYLYQNKWFLYNRNMIKNEKRIKQLKQLATSIKKDNLFFYTFVKKSKLNVTDAIEFLKSIDIPVTNKMKRERKKKLKEIREQRRLRKEKKKQSEELGYLPDILWLDDDCDDAKYQMHLILYERYLSDDDSNDNDCSGKYEYDDDLPF